jgi:hypothetical protein
MDISSDDPSVGKALAPSFYKSPGVQVAACFAAAAAAVALTLAISPSSASSAKIDIYGITGTSDATPLLSRECFSSQWSKEYDGVLNQNGFDDIVARCPDGESEFYDRGTSRLQGKFEWYCTSRSKYLQGHRPPTSPSLTVSGYKLVSSPEAALASKIWAQGSFSRRVSFDARFYLLSSGNCYVDFADSKVGGGVFRRGLAQEEKLFLQLPELLLVIRERSMKGWPLYLSSPRYWNNRHNSDVLVFKDVVRPILALPKDIDLQCGWPPKSAQPCASFAEKQQLQSALVTIIAINAEEFDGEGIYSDAQFDFLMRKILAAFGAAVANGCTSLNSGPLGAGVFNGNLGLATILHAVMSIAFDVPVTMWGISSQSNETTKIVGWIEQQTLPVPALLQKLRNGVTWGYGRTGKFRTELDHARWDRA